MCPKRCSRMPLLLFGTRQNGLASSALTSSNCQQSRSSHRLGRNLAAHRTGLIKKTGSPRTGLQHEGICVSIEVASQAVQAVARERIFHPVRNYLEGLRWDSVPRIDHWLNYYLGLELNPYSAAVGSKWLISTIARIYRPGRESGLLSHFGG